MRALLILCVVISAAVACPCIKKKCDSSCSGTSSMPPIVPAQWKVRTFDSQIATLLFQGTWYLQLCSSMYAKDNCPLKTGLFCNTFPSTKNRLIFTDTSPCDDTDWNIEYKLCDSSYNVYTQSIENTQTLFRPAYGKTSNLALFNIGTPKYYHTPICDKYPFIDENLIRHKIGKNCDREYTVAQIGGDEFNNDYMVFALINRYDSYIKGNDHMVYVVTREVYPKWSTYQKAYDDLECSGFNPFLLTSIDQSIDFSNIPSITTDQINGLIQTIDLAPTTSTSTVVIQVQKDYVSSYELCKCEFFDEKYQMMKAMDALNTRKALSGKYFLNSNTPGRFSESTNQRVGLLYTNSPAVSLQLVFDSESCNNPWDSKMQYMAVDQGYDQRTGTIVRTRSMISSLYDDDHRYGRSLFRICTEGYYEDDIPETSPFTFDGMIPRPTSDIFNKEIIFSIIGCNPEEYLLIRLVNKYKNLLFDDDDVPLVYCYTRQRNPCHDTIRQITQELLRCGINPNVLSIMDQSMTIDEEYTFTRTTFETEVSCWSSSSSSSSSSMSSTTITSTSTKASTMIAC